MRRKVFALFAPVLVLAACSGSPQPLPTPPSARAVLTATTAPRVTPVPSNTPAPPPLESPTAAPVCRATTGANLRAGPGTEFPKVGGLAGGQPLLVIAKNQDGSWLQLDSGNWIKGELTENCPDVQVASVLPTPPLPATYTSTRVPPTVTFTPQPIQ